MQCSKEQFKHIYYFFSFIKRKQPLQLMQLLLKLILTISLILLRFPNAKNGLDSKVIILTWKTRNAQKNRKRTRMKEYQDILDQNQGRKQEDLADLLSVTPDTVFSHLKTIGKIEKEGKSAFVGIDY